jgi:Ca2+-binding RTX toxin-like protein
MSRRLKGLGLATVVAMVALTLVPGVAFADLPTCVVGADPTVLNVNMVSGSSNAFRVAAGNLEVDDAPPADLDNAAFVVCPGAAALGGIQRINFNGSGAGNETVRLDSVDFEGFVNVVDLGNGNDSLDFTRQGDDVNINIGVGLGGQEVAGVDGGDQADDADVLITNAENISVTGDPDDVVGVNDEDDVDGQAFFALTAKTIGAHTVPAASGPFGRTITFNGGAAEDQFFPGGGNDVYNAGPGVDLVNYNNAPAAVVVDLEAKTATGGSGNDTLNDVEVAAGTTGFDDTLNGSALDNTLVGLGGDDTIDGRAGNDVLSGGLGDDTFLEGAAANGADTITGGGDTGATANAPDARDTVDYSGRTVDLYFAPGGGPISGAGGCPIGAGCEDDALGLDIETFLSGSGNDTFVGTGGDEHFQGGAGNDNMSGGAGGEDFFLFGDSTAGVTVDVPAGTATGNGNDVFSGVEGFSGSEFNDTFIDDTTTDTVYYGEGGDDLFNQGASPPAVSDDDAFSGGDGRDHLDYGARTNDLDVNLDVNAVLAGPQNGESGESDDIVEEDIEDLTGGSGDDSLDGNENNNVITDGDGNDTVGGDEGNDLFVQGAAPNGSDALSGNEGADAVDYGLRTGNVRVSLGGTSGNNGEGCVGQGTCEGDTIEDVENATTGAGNDLVVGSGDDNLIATNAGNDKVNVGGGQDSADGGEGSDRIIFATGVGVKINLANSTAAEIGSGAAGGLDQINLFENATGSLKADIIAGNAEPNKLAGLAGNDIIKGKKGDDKLSGHQGKDNLNGGAGNDRGNGGPGRDRCRKIENESSCEK